MSQRIQENSLQPFDASAYRVGIVVAQFNADITEKLLESALAEAKRYKIPEKNITIHRAAGSVEIPLILEALATSPAPGGGRYDVLVALGAVVRGETDHYTYVAKIVTEGVFAVMLKHKIPVGFGILTCETVTQAKARLNTGAGALAAALQSAKVVKSIH
jgi:6,7-dimethyl-8-ribityllumazine synthase